MDQMVHNDITSQVIAYRSLELLFGTQTFHFNCFFDDFNCVFTQIHCLYRVLEYLWISINRIMDIHKSFLGCRFSIYSLFMDIHNSLDIKNHAELRISIIHFRISINRFMDIQYSSYLRISKNELWISINTT